jgi:hypothetical protein
MNNENGITGSSDCRETPVNMRQQLRERAQRLYMIGELNMAAQLFLELATGGYPEQPKSAGEACNG